MRFLVLLFFSLLVNANGNDVEFLNGAEVTIDPYEYLNYDEINVYTYNNEDVYDYYPDDDTELTLTVNELYYLLHNHSE